MPSIDVSWDFILKVIALIVGAAGAVTAIIKAGQAIGNISVRKRVTALESRMNSVESRLVLGDKRFQSQSDDLGQVLITMHAVVMHMISGNDKDKLQNTEKELTAYMAKRKTHMGGTET